MFVWLCPCLTVFRHYALGHEGLNVEKSAPVQSVESLQVSINILREVSVSDP
jgi:hypothetical protein